MKKLVIALLAIVALGALFGLRGGSRSVALASEILPWIEIESGTVSYFDTDSGEYIGEAQNGEDVTVPVLLATSDDANVVLHFGDGSEARIDSGAEIIIEDGTYNKETDTLSTHIYVSAGRVWSKIIELSTSDSSWEVETSTAVATVRGTAFGVLVEGDESVVVGSENTVEWVPLDQETRERLVDIGVTVTPEDVVAVRPELIEQVRKKEAELIVAKHGVDTVKRAWAVQNEERDEQIEEIRAQVQGRVQEVKEVLREKALERREEVRREVREKVEERAEDIKTQLRERMEERVRERKDQLRREAEFGAGEIREAVKSRVEERTDEIRGNIQKAVEVRTEELKEQIRENADVRINAREEVLKQEVDSVSAEDARVVDLESNVSAAVVVPKAIVLRIERVNDGQKPIENVELPMRAVVEFSDGSKKDVTKSAQWRVLGPIGSFKAPGVFIPRVFDEERERGKVEGSVFAAWKSEAGDVVFGNSPQFEVEVVFDGVIDARG